MRANNTFGIHFILRMNRIKDGAAPIYARISVDGKRVEISLKRSWNPANWNNLKGQAKGSTSETKAINIYLDQVRNRLFECYQELSLKKQLITAEAIKNLYCGEGEKEHTLLSIFDYHNREMKNDLEWGTLKNYFTTRRYVEEFVLARYKTSDVYLAQLNYKFLTDFERFMKTYVPKDSKLPCGQNTTMKHIERLRKVVNMSVKNDWLERDPFLKFSPSFIKTTRQYLTVQELEVIEQRNFGIERLERIKDLFVFSCYTGLAYIDVMNLTPMNIVLGIDGEKWISTKRHKTDIPVKIPVLPKAMEIIKKYQDDPRVLEKGSLLPTYANQILNS